jgi:hypothetical protein
MLDSALIRHREFATALKHGEVEQTAEGIFFPAAQALAVGEYFYSTNGGETETTKNLIPTEGLNYLLATGLGGGAAATQFYLALYSGNYTPAAGLTAATFSATSSEIVSNTEGYSETTRRLWTPTAASAGQMDNLNTRATFTIATTGSVVIRGAALISDSGKGSVFGTLISAGRFTQDRVHYAGDVFTLGYRVRLQA